MKGTSSPPIITNAYAVVSKEDSDIAVAATAVELDRPASRTVSPQWAHIPEARELSWDDDFFDDDDDVVAVFDLDYDNMESYYSNLSWVCYGASSVCLPNFFWLSLLLGVPCIINKNVNWNVRNQHVAITRDGIRFVHDKRQTCWGHQCTDAGKTTKTIPFDKITDCAVVEPAGNTCMCVPNTLHVVHIDTASRTENQQHELSLTGLKNAETFKKLVWAMKRTYHPAVASLPPVLQMVDRGASSDEDVATLLRDIRDELRVHNAAIQSLKQPPAPSAPELL